MKKFSIFTTLVLIQYVLVAQNVGIGTTSPDPKAQLEVSSTSKGLLIPRLTTAQRTSIVTPPKGLMVYDSTLQIFYYYDGSNWQGVSNSSNAWSLSGNSGSDPTSQFIGTTDN